METIAGTNNAPTQTTMPIAANDGMPPDIEKDDIIRKNIPRELPCKLTDEEFVRISRQRVGKEAERAELAEELGRETKKRKEQIEGYDELIKKMGRELHTGFQDRTVKCIEVFKMGADRVGYVHTLRTDTWKEVERRPATAFETQRHLKGVDDQPSGGILDEARARQRSAQNDDVPTESKDAPSDDVPVAEEPPSESAASEAGGTSEATEEKPTKKNGRKKS